MGLLSSSTLWKVKVEINGAPGILLRLCFFVVVQKSARLVFQPTRQLSHSGMNCLWLKFYLFDCESYLLYFFYC